MQSMTIPRRPPQGGEFERLRSEGLRMLQELGGQNWTDYNVHDPGVTMLETLCYALTDLGYRADLPVADLLTGANGKIDFVRQSLHVPETIYACRPATAEDYRRVLLDRVPGVDNVIISSGAAAGLMPGLYRIDVKVASPVAGTESAGLRQEALRKIGAAFRNLRNIGEDVAVIAPVEEAPCYLIGEVEIDSALDPVDILADIYDCCDRIITAAPDYSGVQALKDRGMAADQIFDGPAFRSGIIRPAVAGGPGSQLFVGDLAKAISALKGVKDVTRLAISVEGGEPASGAVDWCWPVPAKDGGQPLLKALSLQVPATAQEMTISLMRRGSRAKVAAREAALKFADLRAHRRSHRQPDPGMANAFPRPKGEYRDLPGFVSSQQHFPPVYGLNRYGVPEWSTAREKAAMRQLKGYLALCDQVMAHAAAQLHHARDLYSADPAVVQSYWWQMLDNEELPDIEKLYNRSTDAIVAEVYQPFDAFVDRKSRVFDYLLALYGESYSQDSLRKFGSYYNDAELKNWLLKNKAAFVKDIVRLGRDRYGGFDYGSPTWDRSDNCSGLQRRIGLLLGFYDSSSRSLIQPITERRLSLGKEGAGSASADSAASQPAQPQRRLLRLPFEWPQIPGENPAEIEERVKAILRTSKLQILLRAGLHREHYRIANVAGSRQCELLLDIQSARDGAEAGRPEWLTLADAASWEEAAMIAAQLRASLLGLNQQCNGVHLVEHCLLRPCALGRTGDPSDYALRATLIFPGWATRSYLGDFRRFAEETVQINFPAHVRAQCLWLDFDAMRAFESCYRDWLQAKMQWCRSESAADAARVDQLALDVMDQLRRNGADLGPSTEKAAGKAGHV